MKKLFTLFMATVVAMSMMALPQVKLAGKKTAPASHEQFEAKTPAQTKVMELHKASMVERDFVRTTSAKKVAPATLATPKKLAAAPAEVITLHFDGFSVAPEYYEETGDWYMSCADAEGWIVKFDILSESYVGTFTTEDFDLAYSYMYTPDEETVDYVSIECTIKEEKKSEHLTVLSLDATIEGSDGNTYKVTCVQNSFTAKEVVEHTIADATLEFDGAEFVLAGKNEVLDLNLDVYATWPTGPFTKGEFNLENTKVLYNGVEQELNNPELVVSVGKNEEGQPGYVADFNFYNQDTIQHVVDVFAPLAAPSDTVEIEMINLQVDDSWAMIFEWVYYTAVDNNWDIYAGVAGLEATEGTWSGDDVMLYITNQETGDAAEAIYAEATVVNDEEKGWLVKFEGLCDDGKYYVVNMKFEIPEPTKTVEVRFENSAKASFYPDLGNDLMLSNDNGNYYVALDIYNVPMGGEFTLDNMDTYYTQMIDWNNMVELQIADVKGTINQRGDTTIMTAQVICFDAVLYDIELWYVVPTPTETVQLTVEAAFDNQLETQGYYTLHGQADGTDLLVAMSPITEEVTGTFVNDGVFAGFGAEGGQYDFYSSYTYVAKPAGVDEWGDPQYDVYAVDKGTLTVTMDENNNIVAKASVICSNAVQYEITMTSKYDIPHLELDAEEPVDYQYTSDAEVTLELDEEYGLAAISIKDETTMTSMYFFFEEADAEIIIPEGTYEVNATEDYGTVYASPGYDGYYVYPSFFAYIDEDDYLLPPLWFMVGGEATVTNVDGKLKLEVNALNSYNQPIHIVYDPTADGLENIPTEHIVGNKKMVVDGQLVIIRDGKAYNAIGAQVK